MFRCLKTPKRETGNQIIPNSEPDDLQEVNENLKEDILAPKSAKERRKILSTQKMYEMSDLLSLVSLQCPNKLEDLILRDKQIDDEDAQILASRLKYVPTLQYLILCNNQIGDEGAKPSPTVWKMFPSGPPVFDLNS